MPLEKTGTSYPRASLGMSCRLILLTTSSHGFNRACLGHHWCVSLLGSQNRTQGHTGSSLGLPFFLGAFLLRQGCQISLHLVIHRLLDRTDRIEQIAVAHQTCLSFYLRGFRVDQSLLFQLPYVFCNRVSAHAGVLANPPDTGPALMRFPVLAENQVSINRQFAGA